MAIIGLLGSVRINGVEPPCYGMAEATLLISGGLVDEVPIVLKRDGIDVVCCGMWLRDVVCCGEPAPETSVWIVDPQCQALGDGETGEIWVSGGGGAQGY